MVTRPVEGAPNVAITQVQYNEYYISISNIEQLDMTQEITIQKKIWQPAPPPKKKTADDKPEKKTVLKYDNYFMYTLLGTIAIIFIVFNYRYK